MSGLTLKQANTIVEGAFAKAHEMKIKPLAVVVLDAAGNIVSAQARGQCEHVPHGRRARQGVGRGWRWAARAARSAKRAKDNPNFFLSLAATANGKFSAADGARR